MVEVVEEVAVKEALEEKEKEETKDKKKGGLRWYAEASKGAREREAFWDAVRKEERKLVKKFLIDPDAYEAEVQGCASRDEGTQAEVWAS